MIETQEKKDKDEGNGLKTLIEDQDQELVRWCRELHGEPDIRMEIFRLSPQTYDGESTRGSLETTDWIPDADELRKYLRDKWGGAKFRVTPKRADEKGRPRIVTNIIVDLPGKPLNNGKSYADKGGSDMQTQAAMFNNKPATDKAIEVVERAAMQRAQSAESSANQRVQLLEKQADDLRLEAKELRDRITTASREVDMVRGESQRILLEQQNRQSEQVNAIRDSHRQEMDRVRDMHRQELDRLRDDMQRLRDSHLTAINAVRMETRDSYERETARMREDAKDRVERTEKAYESQLRDRAEQIKRLHEEVVQLRNVAMQKQDPIEQARGLAAIKEALGDIGDEPPSTLDKILESLPAIADAAPTIMGATGGMVRGAMGLPQQQQQQMQMRQQQMQRRPSVLPLQQQKKVVAQKPVQQPVAPQPLPPAPTAVGQELLRAISQLEVAINAAAPPMNFANGLVQTVSAEVLNGIMTMDNAQLLATIERLSPNSVISSMRGKRYLSEVMECVRKIVASREVAPEPVVEEKAPGITPMEEYLSTPAQASLDVG